MSFSPCRSSRRNRVIAIRQLAAIGGQCTIVRAAPAALFQGQSSLLRKQAVIGTLRGGVNFSTHLLTSMAVTDHTRAVVPDAIARETGETPPSAGRRLWPWAVFGAGVLALAIAFLAYLPG